MWARRHELREARLEETILALLAMSTKVDLTTGAGLREARVARLEAYRLREQLDERRPPAASMALRPMTESEWEAKYGPDAPTAA